MAHFAKIGLDNIVLAVVVVANRDTMTSQGVEDEAVGTQFLARLTGHDTWVQCSYNGTQRKNFPAPGWVYDSVRDAFIPPQPDPTWTLDEETCLWVDPAPPPEPEPEAPPEPAPPPEPEAAQE